MLITTVHSYKKMLPGWSISLDAIGIKHFAEVSCCLRHFFKLSGGLQHAKITLSSFLRMRRHGFLVIKQEKFILFDVFSCHYNTAKWMRWKLNVEFCSVHRIGRTSGLNVLKITTLNKPCAFLSYIILWWFTNLYISKTFCGYWF